MAVLAAGSRLCHGRREVLKRDIARSDWTRVVMGSTVRPRPERLTKLTVRCRSTIGNEVVAPAWSRVAWTRKPGSTILPMAQADKLRRHRPRPALLLGGFLIALVLAGVISSLPAEAGRIVLLVLVMGCAVGGGVLGSVASRRKMRALAPELYRPANPALARRIGWIKWGALAWTLILASTVVSLFATGHALIAVVVLISYVLLTYFVSLAAALERSRRGQRKRS